MSEIGWLVLACGVALLLISVLYALAKYLFSRGSRKKVEGNTRFGQWRQRAEVVAI